jgi:hypothetical protein
MAQRAARGALRLACRRSRPARVPAIQLAGSGWAASLSGPRKASPDTERRYSRSRSSHRQPRAQASTVPWPACKWKRGCPRRCGSAPAPGRRSAAAAHGHLRDASQGGASPARARPRLPRAGRHSPGQNADAGNRGVMSGHSCHRRDAARPDPRCNGRTDRTED